MSKYKNKREWTFTVYHDNLHRVAGVDEEVFTAWFMGISKASTEPGHYDDTEAYINRVRYGVMQCETCPSTGRLHYQGYIEFEKPASFKKMQALFQPMAPGVHVEPMKENSSREA